MAAYRQTRLLLHMTVVVAVILLTSNVSASLVDERSDSASVDAGAPRNGAAMMSSPRRSSDDDVTAARPSITPSRFRVMPLGDSLSICCNYCAVPAGVLVRKELSEPPTPWDGYLRKLWLQLKEEELLQEADSRRSTEERFRFTYVGRVHSCMVNRSESMRVPDDWEIRYEGYYGYTTARVWGEVLKPAIAANDPDVVLLLLGTNDLIQTRAAGTRTSRVMGAIQNLRKMVQYLLTAPRQREAQSKVGGGEFRFATAGSLREVEADAAHVAAASLAPSRHVFLAKVPPIWFSQIKAVPPSGRKPKRVSDLNARIHELVDELVASQKRRFLSFAGAASERFVPTVHLVDMNANVSVTRDLHGDGLHPNSHGEAKISSRWFHALRPLMDSPLAFRRVLARQNDDELADAYARHVAATAVSQRPHQGADNRAGAAGVDTDIAHSSKAHRRRTPSAVVSPVALFGEAPGTVDAALVPIILGTFMLYLIAVCRPAHRWMRHTYQAVTSRISFSRSRHASPAP